MSPFDLINLFVRPPGDLLYFLTLLVITLAGGLMAYGHRTRRPSYRATQRYTVATLGSAVALILMLIGALYTLFSRENAVDVLPPLERAANMTTLLLLGWAFLTADHERWGRQSNVIVLLLLLLIVGGYVVTGLQWPQVSDTIDFNLSVYGVAWAFVALILCLLAVGLLVVNLRLIADAPLKLVLLVLLILGYGFTLLQTAQGTIIGDYAGAARMGTFVALLIVPAIIYRAIVGQFDAEIVAATTAVAKARAAQPPPRAAQPVSTRDDSPIERQSAQLLKALGVILTDATPTNVPQRIVDAALEALKSDVGALLRVQDANYADITCGYDRVMKRAIPSNALNLDHQATLSNAIERQAQRGMFPDRNVKELDDLYTRMDIAQRGPVYFQPLMHDKQLVAVLMIALPYTGRELRDFEQELMKGLAVISSSLLALSYAAYDARRFAEERVIQAMVEGVSPDEIQDDDVLAARQEMEATLKAAHEQIAQLSRTVMEMKIELDYERSRIARELEDTQEGLSISKQMLAVTEEQQRLRDERDRLATRLQEAEAALAAAAPTTADLNPMIAALEREKASLEAQKEALQTQLDNLRANDKVVLPGNLDDVISSMTEENARLKAERAQMETQLTDIETQLKGLGIEDGPRGLAQLLSQLYEQRLAMEARYSAFKRERDALLAERARMESNITNEQQRDTRIEALENEIRNLAADRETLSKQRDQLQRERQDVQSAEDRWKMQRSRLLAQIDEYRQELEDAHAEQQTLRAQIQTIADERSTLVKERDGLLADRAMLQSERSLLYARIEGDRERLNMLESEGVGSLTGMVDELSTRRDQLERELNEARTRIASLENKLQSLEISGSAVPQGVQHLDNPDLLLGLVQELRTPMTSIVGYVELLLNESLGILGDGQRKVMHRVLANVMRLASMLEDLIRLTALDTGKFALVPEPVNLVALIEDALTNAGVQFREKGLSVHLNLDDDLPPLHADRDAMNQIIGQLLTNAYLVSPPESDVFVSAQRDRQNPARALHMSVEDRGGGIDPVDEARVFSRKYKAENPLIQGIGDTGVGLAIAKALVEAHSGRLWLESRPNLGSIFHVVLPLEAVLEK